jgi:hypothetical protein
MIISQRKLSINTESAHGSSSNKSCPECLAGEYQEPRSKLAGDSVTHSCVNVQILKVDLDELRAAAKRESQKGGLFRNDTIEQIDDCGLDGLDDLENGSTISLADRADALNDGVRIGKDDGMERFQD